MEQINAFFGRVFDYLRGNPKYGLFVAMALVALYLQEVVYYESRGSDKFLFVVM